VFLHFISSALVQEKIASEQSKTDVLKKERSGKGRRESARGRKPIIQKKEEGDHENPT